MIEHLVTLCKVSDDAVQCLQMSTNKDPGVRAALIESHDETYLKSHHGGLNALNKLGHRSSTNVRKLLGSFVSCTGSCTGD